VGFFKRTYSCIDVVVAREWTVSGLYCGDVDSVRESSGRVLVHCLAGISRSPTVVIAYVMYHLRLSIDDAYRYDDSLSYLYSVSYPSRRYAA